MQTILICASGIFYSSIVVALMRYFLSSVIEKQFSDWNSRGGKKMKNGFRISSSQAEPITVVARQLVLSEIPFGKCQIGRPLVSLGGY